MNDIINIYIDYDSNIYVELGIEDKLYKLVFECLIKTDMNIFIHFLDNLYKDIANNADEIYVYTIDNEGVYFIINYRNELFELSIEDRLENIIMSNDNQELCNIIVNKFIEFYVYCINKNIFRDCTNEELIGLLSKDY